MAYPLLPQRTKQQKLFRFFACIFFASLLTLPGDLYGEGVVFKFLGSRLNADIDLASHTIETNGSCVVGEACNEPTLAAIGLIEGIGLLLAPQKHIDFDILLWNHKTNGVQLVLDGALNEQLPDMLTQTACANPILLVGSEGTALIENGTCKEQTWYLGPGLVGFGPAEVDQDGFESYVRISFYPVATEGIDDPLPQGWTTYGRLLFGWDSEYPWAEVARPLEAPGLPLSHFVEEAPQMLAPLPLPTESPHLTLHLARAAGYSTTSPLEGEPNEILQLDFEDFISE